MTTAEQHETRVKMVGMIQGIQRYAVAVSGSLGQVVSVGWETIWDVAWLLYLCNKEVVLLETPGSVCNEGAGTTRIES